MNCIVKGAHIVGLFVLLLYAPAAISYDYSCSRDARNLKYAADNYESALSEYESAKSSYESAKSSYESACASGWGYSQNDESACGAYGYERTSLESARDDLESARDDLESAASDLDYALQRVNRRCGGTTRSLDVFAQACMAELKKSKDELSKCRSEIEPAKPE